MLLLLNILLSSSISIRFLCSIGAIFMICHPKITAVIQNGISINSSYCANLTEKLRHTMVVSPKEKKHFI